MGRGPGKDDEWFRLEVPLPGDDCGPERKQMERLQSWLFSLLVSPAPSQALCLSVSRATVLEPARTRS